MSEFADLFRHDPPSVSAVRAIIANTPSDLDDELFVTVQAFDGARQTFGPCRWVPANGIPAQGDECLLVLTEDDRTPWAITTAPVYAAVEREIVHKLPVYDDDKTLIGYSPVYAYDEGSDT